MDKKTVIIALGGNALSPKKEAGTINQQFRHPRDTLKSVMHFVRLNYNICIWIFTKCRFRISFFLVIHTFNFIIHIL